MQEKLKSLQNIMSQRGYNKSASTVRENTDLKSNLKSLQDILVKRGYTPKSVPSEQKSKTRHKEKGNNLFEETSKSTFETMPKYQEAKQKHQEEEQHRLNATYNKYGIDPNNFSYDDFSKWAEEHNFNRIPHNDPLEAGYDWLPNEKGVSKEVKKDKETLEQLALNNQRKNIAKEGGNAPDTFITSLMDGATLGGRSAIDNLKSQKKYKEAGLNVNDYVSEKQANAKSSEEHPIASTVGDLAGSTASLIGLGEAVGGALKGVKWLTKTPTWVQGAIKNGIVFGLQQGTEATTDGKKAKDIAKETAIGVVGGAVGGATSSTVEDFAENILFKTKLQHKFIPEMIRNGVAGASFAGADSAATYFLHPKEERPTAKDVAKNMAVTFAFATITSAINMGKIKQSSKEALDVVNDKMMKDYEGMMNSASTNDVESVKQFAKNVMDYSDSMIKYLDGEGFKLKNNAPSDTVTEYLTGKGNAPVKDTVLEKARFVGEDARVRSMQEDLRTIKSRAKEFYDRADSIPYDVEKISKTSNVGNVDNITKELTNINNTNSTPQNKNSIQNVPKTSEVEPIQTVQEQTPISVKTNDVEVQKTDKLPKEVQDSVSKADVVAENNPQGYNKDFVRRYANSFVEVAQKSDNYPNRDFLDNNIADELTQKILTGESKLDGNSDFDYAVKQFKFILNQADESKLNQVQQFNENQKQQNDVSASEINTDNSIINDTVDGVNSADTPTTTDTVFNDTQENGVQPSVNRVTEEVHNAMNKVGLNVSESATGIQEANTKFMSNNDNLFDRNYVSNYANDFVQAMSEKNGRSYTVLSQETDNLADELVNKTLTGNSVLDGNREFQTVVRNFKDVLREGIKKNANLHNNVYGANEVLNAQVQDIENGDYSSLNITENLTDSQASSDTVEGPIRTLERPSKTKSSKVLKQIARESIKNYNSKIQLSELDNKVSDLYNAMQNGIDNNNGILNNDTSNTAWEMAENIASDVADNIEVEDETTNEEEYKRLRSWVYNTPLKISDQDKSDLMGSDSFNDFRKNNFGTLRLTNDGIPVDSFYGELSNMFPQYFNSEVQTHPADQLQTIQNVIERLKPKKRSLTRQEYNDVVQQLTVDIFSRVMTYVLEGKNEVETENNKLYDSNTFGLFEPFGGDFVVKQDIEYKQEFVNNAFKVKIKNGKYQLKDGITYGHFGMHANSKGDIIITYLPIGKAVAVVPDRQQADKFVIEAEKNTKKYLLYLYKTENGEIAVGGDVNSFMNVIKNIQSDIKDKYTTDDVQSNEPQNNDSVTENDTAVQTNDNATQTTETEQKEQHTESISDDNVTSKVTLAPLTGSQKQINWAEAIRKDFYDKWVHRAKIPEEFDFLNYIFQTKTDSSEWIDNESRSSQTKWLRKIREEYQKSKSGMIDNSSNDIPNNDVQNNSEAVNNEPLADKCSVIKTQHTKTGEDLWVVELKDKISADEYKKLNTKVKEVGGYYSRYAKTPDGKSIPGFIFKAEPTEEVFDAFNDFFKTTGTLKETDDVQADENVKDSQSTNNNTESDEENVSENNKTVLNSQSKNDTIKEKPDLEIGDVIEYDGRQWEVTQTGLNMSFKNLDKSDSKQTFSHIGTMENFKQTHDYKIISKADNSKNINEVKDDDIDKSRKILEDSNRIDKSKTGIEAREIFQRRNSDNNISGGLSRIDEKGCTVLEKRKIQEVAELDSFKKLSWFVANEISADKNKNLYKKYENDSRWDEGYDFREMVTYDMLTDSQNELRVIFNDNIAEYFNKYIDPITDITGKKLPLYITKGTKNSIVKNKHGQLIPLYHGTGSKFNEFKCGDIGIHFGSYSQAIRRVKDKGITNPIYIKAYLNITNPIYIDKDFWNWNADQVVADLDKQGIISSEDGLKILNIADLELKNSKLREILKNKGYDGIVYNNEIEAISGKSYIVFDDKQIFRMNTDTNQVGIKKADNQKNGGKENGISQQVANFVEEKLQKGEKFTSDTLFKKTGEIYDGSLADNTFTVKDAYDAMELGINQYILNMKEEPTLDKMFEIIDKIPTQTKRTEGMDNYQQFSTPPTLAYLANYAANINSNDIMLEPSAGIGGIATFAKKSGAKVIVNELDPRRMAILKNMPFDDFYSEDAEQINNILGGDIEPSVVVMNPPFSSSTTRNMKGAKIGAKHIEEALKMLKTDGRLVAITGKTMADDAPAFRNWWNDIKKKYNVVANIGISGKNFNKYGTNFGIQMMVIDNNGATKNTITDYVEDLHDLQSILGGIRNERPILDYSANEQRATTTTRKEIATTRTKGSVGGGTVSDTSSGIDTEQSSNKGRVPKRRDVETKVLRNDGSGGNTVNQRADKPNELDDERRLDGRRKPRGNDELQDTGGTDKSDSVEHSVQSGYGGNEKNGGLRQNGVRVQRLKKKELTDNVFEEYKVAPLKVKNAKPHPAKLSESAAMSAVKAPNITYKPHIDQKLIDEGTLSSAQLEVVSRAGQCHSQTLPNGETRGFFCGDGTGVGKGRTVAGIILDNFNQGRKKAVWISKGHDLLKDTLDYTKDVFGRNDMVVEFNGGKKADSSLKSDDTILYLTYNKLSQGWNKENSNFEKIVSWLGKDFDGVIAFDEAHMMSNAGGKVTNRGKTKPSETALAGIELQKLLPKAKVIYMSATGATEVENLQYATRLGLWGEGTAFPNEKEFISQIKGGGISAMEMLAQDLKMEGVYLSRNISYEDVTYDKLTHKLTKEQKKMYNTVAKAWQIVFQNLNEALKETHQSSDGTARGQVYGKFWSSNQRFFNQILVSMQTPSVIKDIEKQLAKGKSCIIQLTSTNEAQGKRELARLYEEGLTLDDYDVSPKQMLMEYVEKSFPVQQYEEYKDEKGNVKSKPVYNSKGEPVLNREAVRKRDTLLDQLGSMKAPSSPIDMIINAFGTDLVAENTGRSSRVINVDGKNVQQRLSNNTRSADVEAFQNGKKRIMIFSEAGGTGKSYHASKAAKNQQQRVHYLLEAGWKASTAVQGFGRSHRSNQVSAPIFKLVTTDLKGQSRFISTIAKRLAQLGSLTKGQRQAGSQGMFSEDDNLENAFSATVLKSYITALAKGGINDITNGKEIISKLGLNVYNSDGSINQNSDDLTSINKFLNRILSLEYDEQNEVFDEFDSQLKMATAEAEQNGTLDKGMENYKADKVSVKETKTVHTDKLSGAETLYYSLVADKKIKKNEFSDIQSDSPRFKGFYQNKSNGGVRAITQIANKTDSNGNVVSRFKAEGQEYGKTVYLSEQQVSQRWNKIDNETAKALWNKRLEEMPEYRQENVHLISGAVLPVWDKLPETNIKVYRILTDNGDVLIGRVISENAIDSILRRLGANRIKDKVDVSSIIDTVKSGDIVYLENGWSLKQSRVANEQRIELTGPRFDDYDFVKKLGVFSERISFQTRFFIPTKTNTENIIDKLVQYSPYDRTETRYSKGDDSNGWEVKKPEQEKQIENVEDDSKKTSDKSNADIRYSKQANNLDSWTSDVKQSSKNQKNKKLGDIVSYISKKFNIPISKGNLSLTRAKGEFKKLPKAVRLRIANDLPTATHELGHLLDDEYDFTSSANIDEIIDFAQRKSPTLMKQYKKSEVPDEAVAEFVREFVKDPQSTIKEVPKFSKEFIETLSPKDAQALKTLSEYSQQYYNSDFMDKVDAAMTNNKEIKKRSKSTASEISKEIYTKLVDSFAPIKEATDYVKEVKGTLSGKKDAYILAINSKNVDATMSTIFKEGMVDPNGNLTGGKGLIDCIKDISHKDIDLFDKYLVLKHSLEWIEPQEGAKLKRVFSDDTLQNSERIKREIANLENSHPEFKEASENLYKFQQDMLKYWVVSMGGMDAITYNKLQKMYPHYVPFMRDTGRNRTGFKSSFANQQSPVKTAKGSGATIISPLESIIKNVEKQVKFGTRNRVMAVLGMYADNVPGFANFIEPVPPDQVKNIINIEKLSDEFLGRMSESLDENDLFNLTEVFEDVFGTQVESYTPVVIPGKQIVTYLNKGKHKYYQVHDKALFNAITNLTPVQTGKIMNFAGRTLGITNALITQLNPVFATTNAIRDYDTAMKNSKAYNNPITFTGAYMSALWDVIRNSDNYKQYKAAGGGHMSMFSDNIDVLKKTLREVNSKDAGLARRLAQAIFLHPIECVTKINEITEAIPRLAEFKGMKKKGADNQQAIYAASDITVNFNRSGDVGRKLNKIFRFSNATVQGMDKQARIFTSGGKKEIAKHMLRYLISAILTTALLEFWNRTSDEDGWEELSQYQKNNFYCISIGNGKFIKIPKAREAAILNTTAERAADYAFGDKEAFYQFGQYIGDTTLPAWLPVTGIAEGGIEEGVHQAAGGTILGGIVDNMVNKDFKGTPIVSSALEDEPNKEQYNQKTSLLAKSIGQTFNWSPMKIDHLIDNYTGIIGKLNRSVTADGFNPSNLYGTSFSADSVYSTDVFNRVYEQRDKMQKKYQNEPTPQNACLYEKYATKAAYITQANKAIKRLSEDEQRTARKELITDIKATGSAITDTDKGIVNSFSNGLLTSDNGYVDSLPKSTITKTKNKQSYTWEMTYSEYKKYYDDYRKEVEKQRKKLLNTSAYKRASDIEKTEMLKQLSKDVLKDTKEKYKNRNALKFKKDE